MRSIIKIEGMDCSGCVTSVENCLKKTPGVNSVIVSLEENQAAVDYDENVINLSDINQAIEDLGFDVV